MVYLLPILFVIVLALVIGVGSYLLRRLLPPGHALQSRLTDEAISSRIQFAIENAKGVMAVLLVIYFLTVGFIYS
ncbi:hypothetical protein [Variovorax gossypii]